MGKESSLYRLSRRQLIGLGVAGLASLVVPKKASGFDLEKRPVKVIFVHGWQGQGTLSRNRDETWVDSVKDFCRDNRIPSVYPDFPGGVTPSASVWMRKLNYEVEEADREGRDSLLLLYSLGARAGLVWADACIKQAEGYSRQTLDKVKAMILVAPFNNDLANALRRGGAYANFFEYQADTEAIGEAIPIKRVLHAPKDHQIDYKQGVQIAADIKATLITPSDGEIRHFNRKEDGAIVIEVLEEALRSYAQTT